MGVGGAQNWKAEKKYKANFLVYTNEKLYICMEDHTSGTDFATDLLSGKWKFIGNGVGSNVSQTQLLSSPLTTTGADITATLSDNINNYDYAILTFSPTVSGIRKSEVIKVNDTTNSFVCLMEYTTQSNELHYAQVSGAISNDNITIRNRNADVTWASIDLESVIGIKIQELTTDYIANLAMPSDVYENMGTNFVDNKWAEFTAPADGWVNIRVLTTGSYNNSILVRQANVGTSSFTHKIVQWCYLCIPVVAGKYAVYVNYNSFDNTKTIHQFVYSVGSAKALGLIN